MLRADKTAWQEPGSRVAGHPWPARDDFMLRADKTAWQELDPVSPAIHGLHGMTSCSGPIKRPGENLDSVPPAIHHLHGLPSCSGQINRPGKNRNPCRRPAVG